MSRTSFDEYVVARSSMLLRFAYLLCGDRHLAEDLVQEVLIKAHRRWDAIDADNPDAYLKQALVRTHVSWLRRRASSEIATDTFAERPGGIAFDEAHASRDELWAMLGRLPRAQRAVLVLRYFEDLDDAKIAELVGVSANTVRTHASRGLATLRDVLAQKAGEAPTSPHLLADVRKRIVHRANRRRVITAAGLAAAIVAMALAVTVTLQPRSSQVPIGPTPTPTETGAPAPTGSSSVSLVPTALSAPTFPYAFDFVPAGLTPTNVNWANEGAITITFGEAQQLVITDGSRMGDPGEGAVATPVTIDGAPASLWGNIETGGEIDWMHDGVQFSARVDFTLYSLDDFNRMIETMHPGSTAAVMDRPIDVITGISLPAGFQPSGSTSDGLYFSRGPDQHGELLEIELLTMTLAGPPDELSVGPLNIEGHTAYTSDVAVAGGQLRAVYVEQTGGRTLRIQYGFDVNGLTIADLVAIYRSIDFRA